MLAGIVAQYGFLYQRYVFIKLALETVAADRFIVYEGRDDIDVAESDQISAIKTYNYELIQVKSGTASRKCWAKVIGNWLLLDEKKTEYKIILENALDFDFESDEIINYVCDYFSKGSERAVTSIANKVYKNFLEGTDELTFKTRLSDLFSRISFEVISVDDLKSAILKRFKETYCSDVKRYEMAKDFRCERFIEYINTEIDNVIIQKKSFTLKYVDFVRIISKVITEISDSKFTVDIGALRSKKTAKAEQLINSDTLREVQQLRLVNTNKGFIIKELVNELFYRDLREVYSTSDSTLISNIEETAHSNYEDTLYSLPEGSEPKRVFDETVIKEISLSIVDNSPIYRKGCYVFLTGDAIDESRQISWGGEDE